MIETEITILVNIKSDIDLIRAKIIDREIQFPVFIFEYENHYQLNFISHYEEWELESAILECFSDYEFSSNLERGRKEVRLQLSRYQSELSIDDWGRQIENPLDETKYLIKKSKDKPERFNPQIKVLFEDNERYYYVNIVKGINKASGEEGFLLLNEYKIKNDGSKAEVLKDKLYISPQEAFSFGCFKMKECVSQDFNEYLENKKKEQKELQKKPRKIIRNFINSCNNSESIGVLENLDRGVIFEKKVNCQQKIRVEGIKEFQEYIKSPNQELCSRELKIRSSWCFDLPSVTIGLKYHPTSTNKENGMKNIEQLGRITFIFRDNKIVYIKEEL